MASTQNASSYHGMIYSPVGLSTCASYAFAPNSLHYCGPERQIDLKGYIQSKTSDHGLTEILDRFETLYKYLVFIASQNHIADPFDPQVVEAYWLGNELLNQCKFRPFARHLSDGLALGKSLKKKHLEGLFEKLDAGVPHHTFHVLNIFRRTGHHSVAHTLSTMDNCRISWGKVVSFNGKTDKVNDNNDTQQYFVNTRPLIYLGDSLQLGESVTRTSVSVSTKPKVGDWVSMHWGYVCEILNVSQVKRLSYFTNLSIRLANRSQ